MIAMQESESAENREAITIYKSDWTGSDEETRAAIDAEWRIARDGENPTREEFERHYFAAETYLATVDLEEAFHKTQGSVVNREQLGRHMVPSASVGDIFQRVLPNGESEYYVCEPIGFREIEIE